MPAACAPPATIDVGAVRVTFLPDGIHHVRPLEQYVGSTPETWTRHARLLDDDGWLVMSLGGLLVETGERKVLVDLGWGPSSVESFHPDGTKRSDLIGGSLLVSLAATGVRPSDIDAVIYSHLHPDHVGWACLADGRPTFPHATHLVHRREWEHWAAVDPATRGAPDPLKVEAIAQRLELVEDGACPAPGVNVLLTPGHTPGHCSVILSSGAARAVVFGDAIHCPLEISEPELDYAYDLDPALARRTKELIARELEDPGTVGVGPHFPNAVFGRLVQGTSGRYLKELSPAGTSAATPSRPPGTAANGTNGTASGAPA